MAVAARLECGRHGRPAPVPLDLPNGWEIRATDGGQFEVLDGGVDRATTEGT